MLSVFWTLFQVFALLLIQQWQELQTRLILSCQRVLILRSLKARANWTQVDITFNEKLSNGEDGLFNFMAYYKANKIYLTKIIQARNLFVHI